jgi:hypothetical protein
VNDRPLGLLAGFVLLTWSAPALAWGDLGHRIICDIAFQKLDAPSAKGKAGSDRHQA